MNEKVIFSIVNFVLWACGVQLVNDNSLIISIECSKAASTGPMKTCARNLTDVPTLAAVWTSKSGTAVFDWRHDRSHLDLIFWAIRHSKTQNNMNLKYSMVFRKIGELMSLGVFFFVGDEVIICLIKLVILCQSYMSELTNQSIYSSTIAFIGKMKETEVLIRRPWLTLNSKRKWPPSWIGWTNYAWTCAWREIRMVMKMALYKISWEININIVKKELYSAKWGAVK